MLCSQGFASPTPVQAASWPVAVIGRDCLGIAKTGSGKTLGYMLPAITHCHTERGATSKISMTLPLCLVCVPTRELALQVHEQAELFGRALGVRAVAVYGGAPKREQAEKLRAGCELVVGTPGRLLDLLDLHTAATSHGRAPTTMATGGGGGGGTCTSLSMASLLVLDEADRMLDMGFEPAIRRLSESMAKVLAGGCDRRQTLLYTATWNTCDAVRRVAAELLDEASLVRVSVGDGGEKLTANAAVAQSVRVVDGGEGKWSAFLELLAPLLPGGARCGERTLVFVNTRKLCHELSSYCWRAGVSCDTINGDRPQHEREAALREFRDGRITMLIATDVAARGLDIQRVERVINYDFPLGESGSHDYVHRIGRTGRAGASGAADTLVTPHDCRHAAELCRILRDAEQPVPAELEELTKLKPPRSHHGGRNKGAKRAAALAAAADGAADASAAKAGGGANPNAADDGDETAWVGAGQGASKWYR